nr:MAG TPA: hypothetical protein [Caudoviricetes sp.]
MAISTPPRSSLLAHSILFYFLLFLCVYFLFYWHCS